ncbi:MAG TPA: DUF4177 domain-containing protein [Gammaproteobacteria bacterium]|nr:DUF4177 domain-containing protein [Gammaproteobacteria bacterium]
MYKYNMIQIPPNIAIAAKKLLGRAPDPSSAAADYLESIVNEQAADGWEFWRVDTIGVRTSPGCIASIFGAKEIDAMYYVVSFRKST